MGTGEKEREGVKERGEERREEKEKGRRNGERKEGGKVGRRDQDKNHDKVVIHDSESNYYRRILKKI